LHELFVKLEGMTPHEYRNGGQGLVIQVAFTDTPFGEIIIAATSKGICHIAFINNRQNGLQNLKLVFPNARVEESFSYFHQQVDECMNGNSNLSEPIKLHIKGTAFQMKVWEALLKIPMGQLETYGKIAASI